MIFCETVFFYTMRRSKAPSQKLSSFSSPTNEIKEFTSSLSSDGDTSLKPRSTSSILDILNTNVDDLPTENENLNDNDTLLNFNKGDECKSTDNEEKTFSYSRPTEDCSSDIQTALGGDHSVNNDIRKFNVVYGKQSKKKHKTWEGDGILELHGNLVTLKDSDGKVLGRASGKKYANLEEGAQLYVGNKEIEVIDEVKVQSSLLERKRPLEQKENCQLAQQTPVKKIKKISNSRKMVFNSPLVSKIADVKPLVMPRPDHEHQWKFNTNNAKIDDVKVDVRLTSKLRPHQRDGVTFLYSCIVGLKNHKYTGAILADEMGLGKTLQTISLLWTLLKQGPYGIPLIQRVLIVTPSSLVGNWNQEFIRWLGKERISTFIVDQRGYPSSDNISNTKTYKNKPCDYLKLPKIPVIIISYEMFVRYHEDISQIKFDLIVCDEGHRLKNNNIRTSLLLNQLECRRRIILTGTPIQNDLQEFHSLIDFVNPGILGTYAEFKRTFEEPIVKSRQPDVGEYVLKKGEEKAQELNFKTSGFILRRTQALVNQYLPAKYETVVFCKPTNIQKLCYNKAAEFWESRVDKSDSETSPVSHLSVMIAMKKISNHPLLVYASNSEEPDDLTVCLCDLLKSSRNNFMLEDSSKLFVVKCLLQNLSKTNEKLVLVSYYTQTLDMLAELCKNFGCKFCRLDGATPSAQRIAIVNKFNSKSSPDSVFLLSGKAGGTGLNLVGASRLVLFDSDWNPASDLQAMARIWRDGQTNSVYIYRLLTAGTIEEKVFQRQLSKASLSETVVDTVASNSTVRLSRDELKDLFTVHNSPCLTHDLMECSCSGCGEILISKDEEGNKSESQNDYQLNIDPETSADSKPSLRMNQLFQWEHHASPFNSALLKEMALNGADEKISFVFRNIISK